jgi:hypothetical protein
MVTFLAVAARARPHRRAVEGGDLGGYGPGHDGTDLGKDLREVAAGLGDQRGVGGDTVDQAGFGEISDFGDVRRIDEKAHWPWPKSFLQAHWPWPKSFLRSPRSAVIALWRSLV